MHIENVSHFNLKHTFDCGQCFRWNEQSNGSYVGVVGQNAVRIRLLDGNLFIETNGDESSVDLDFWKNYFDLNEDYGKIKKTLNRDKIMKTCIEHGFGIRILNQDLWETTVSFIVSANNNIPRIKKIIEKLCETFGSRITFEGKDYYTFPPAERLAGLNVDDLAQIKAGFRDKYILDAAQKFAQNLLDFENFHKLSTDALRAELMKIKGVGRKVADCILLFGLKRRDVFPQDVWIKRILSVQYNIDESRINEFAGESFGKYQGFAQQYLFYYFRGQNTASG